ncbi:DUF357 domain-containing protein [Nanohaloarchaea archaeon]|nr:DUF357 domain-containing protein [Candidatus Nanohaloarchaea archaeon]
MSDLNRTQEELKQKTERWLDELDEELEELSEDVEQSENVFAYRDDTVHFLEQEDFVRAWEAVIYAWGILETLQRLGKTD